MHLHTHTHTHTHTEFQITAKVLYRLKLACLWYETALHTLVSNSHFPVLFLPASYWVHIFYFPPLCRWRFLGINLEVSLWNDVLHMKSEPTIIFLLKENKTLFSLICAPFSICDYNDFFFLLSSSHSLMKMLNKTGFCRGPQGPSTTYFPSGLIAVYHNIFFSLPILQLFSIHVTVLPCKSIWINFASKMLYGSEYIICLSHKEKNIL